MKKHIEIIAGVAWGGKDLVPGDTIDLSESDANMLIHANKAKELQQEKAPAAEPKSVEPAPAAAEAPKKAAKKKAKKKK